MVVIRGRGCLRLYTGLYSLGTSTYIQMRFVYIKKASVDAYVVYCDVIGTIISFGGAFLQLSRSWGDGH